MKGADFGRKRIRAWAREDADSRRSFLKHLKGRGLSGMKLIISGKSRGLVEALE
jgi:transposase-like protein